MAAALVSTAANQGVLGISKMRSRSRRDGIVDGSQSFLRKRVKSAIETVTVSMFGFPGDFASSVVLVVPRVSLPRPHCEIAW